jgi:hypothetical protein
MFRPKRAIVTLYITTLKEVTLLTASTYSKYSCIQQQYYKFFFFLVSATSHVETWLSQQFSSIRGGFGLFPAI